MPDPQACPRFSILVVGYNSHQDIEELLESIQRQPSSRECEILIAENGDLYRQEMADLALRFGAQLVCLPNPGFGTACNRLEELARGSILLLANPDLRLASDILPTLARHLENPKVGAVGPVLRDSDGSEQISWNLPMGLWWEFLETHGLQTWWRRRNIQRFRSTMPDGPWQVGLATAACVAIRRDVYRTVGGFDEAFFLNSEDIELCDRIRAAGFLVLVDPGIEAVHGNSALQSRDMRRFVANRLEGKWLYLSRRYRGARLLLARLLWIENVLIRMAIGWFAFRGIERSRLPGYWSAMKSALLPAPKRR